MPEFWDEEKIIGELDKGRDRVRIRAVSRNGNEMVDIRLFWQDKEGNWQPSKRGLLIPIILVPSLSEILAGAVTSNV